MSRFFARFRRVFRPRHGSSSSRGSVTVFIMCILWAMLVFSFTVGDIARINLAVATARSDAALASNAALTSYDELLKDAYGMFANSKSVDDLSKNVAQYYVTTMKATGIEPENLNETYALIRQVINGANVPSDNENLLRMDTQEADNGTVKNSDGIVVEPILASSISNPVIMKRQIVEYMKFRAPVNLVTGMLEKINVLKDLGNQSAATQQRVEYENSLNNVQNASDDAYNFLISYLNNIEEVCENQYFSSDTRIKYPKNYLIADQPVSGRINNSDQQADQVLCDSYNDLIESIERLAPVKSIINESGTLNDKIELEAAHPDRLENFFNLVNNAMTSETKAAYQYLEGLYDSKSAIMDIQNATVTSAASYNEDVYKLLYDATGIYYGGAQEEAKQGLSYLYKSFFKMYYYIKEYRDEYEGAEDAALVFDGDYEKIHKVLAWAFGEPEVRDNTHGGSKVISEATDGKLQETITGLINASQAALDKYNDVMKDYVGLLYYQTYISEHLADSSEKGVLVKLKDEIANTIEKGELWDKAIENVKTDSIKDSMSNTHDVETQNFQNIDVDHMREQIAEQYKTYKAEFDKIAGTYGVIKEAGVNIEMYKLDEVGSPDFTPMFSSALDILNHYWHEPAASYQDWTGVLDDMQVKSYEMPQAKWDWYAYAMELRNEVSGNAHIIALVKQISEKNIIESEEDREKLKTNGEGSKSAAKSMRNEAQENEEAQKRKLNLDEDSKKESESHSSMKDVTGIETFSAYKERVNLDTQTFGDSADIQTLKFSGVSTEPDDDGSYHMGGLTDLLKNITDLFSKIAETSRDDLYVTEYLTSAFTCLTTGKKNGKDVEEKSITGYTFGEKANKHYRAELEYIIYGQDSEVGNQALAIASISAIRFVLNLIYSFTDPEITTFTTTTATALTAAFPFAMPVVKAVLHVLLSTAETAWDMLQLCDGNSVPIYKTQTTWVCKCSNIIGNVAKKAVDKVADVAVSEAERAAQEFIDNKEKDINDWVEATCKEKKEELIAQLDAHITVPVNEFISNAVTMIKDSDFENDLPNKINSKVDEIFINMEQKIAAEGSGELSFLAQAMQTLINDSGFKDQIKSKVSDLINSQVRNFKENLTSAVDSGRKQIDEGLKFIKQKINSAVDALSKEITNFVSKEATKLKETAKNGINKAADKLTSALDSQISSKLTGTRNVNINMGSGTGTQSTLNNLLSMTYKDYLYLFLFIGLLDGGKNELERAAQLMAVNIRMFDDKYEINQACTMFNVQASSKIKTAMIGRVADSDGITIKNFADGYYIINVSEFAGY